MTGTTESKPYGTCTEPDGSCQELGEFEDGCSCNINVDCQSNMCHHLVCCQNDPSVKSIAGCQCLQNSDCMEGLTCDMNGTTERKPYGTCTESEERCQVLGEYEDGCSCVINPDCLSNMCHNLLCCQNDPSVKSIAGCQCLQNSDCMEGLTCDMTGTTERKPYGTCTAPDEPCQNASSLEDDCGCMLDAECQSTRCHLGVCCQNDPSVKSKAGCQCQDNTDCSGSLKCDLSGVSGGQTDGTCTDDDDPCQDFGNLPEDCGCTIDADCQSGKCHNYICCQSNPTVKSKEGCQCQDNTDCIGSLTCDLSGVSGSQTDGTCTEDDDPCQDFGNLPEDCGCTIDADCQSGKCHNYICCQSNPTVKSKEGCQCQDNTDCIGSLTCDLSGVSGGQTDGTCTEDDDPCQDFGNLPEDCGCTIDADCQSGKCHNYICCQSNPTVKSKEGCQCQDNTDCIGSLTCDLSGVSGSQTDGTCTEDDNPCQGFGNLPEDCGCTIDADCQSGKCHNYICCQSNPTVKSKEGCQCQDNTDCIGSLTCDLSGVSGGETDGTCTEDDDPCQDFGNLPEDCGCTIDADCQSGKCHNYICCQSNPTVKSKEGCQCQDNTDCIGSLTCDLSGVSGGQTDGTCTEDDDPCQDFGNLPEDCGCTIDADCQSGKCHNYICCQSNPTVKSKEGCQCQDNTDCIGSLTCDLSGVSGGETDGTCTEDDDPCQDFGNLPEDCGCTIDADCQSGKCHNYICCQSNPTVKSKEGCQCQDNTDCIGSLTCDLSGVSGGETDGTCTEDDDPCQDFGNLPEDCGCTIDADCQSGKCHNYICCQSNPTVKSKEGCQCQDNTDCIGSLTCDLSGVSGGETDGTCTEDDDPCQDFGNLPEDCGCTIDADCQSGKCHNYICCQSNPTVKSKEGCQCQDNTDCIGSLTCDLSGVSGGQTDGTCTEDDDPCQDFGNLPEDCGCTIDADCQSGKCHNYICCQSNPTVKSKEGCQCQDNTDCIGSLTCDLSGVSGGETDGTCTEDDDPCQDFGNLPEDCGCTIDADCQSGKCHNYICCQSNPTVKSKEGCQCQDNTDCIGSLTCDLSGVSGGETDGTCTEDDDPCQDFGNLPEDCGCTIDADCQSGKCHNYICCQSNPTVKSKEGCQCQDNTDCIGSLTCDLSGVSGGETDGTCTEDNDPCQDFGNLPEDCGCTIDADCQSGKCHNYICCQTNPTVKSKEGCQCQDNTDCIGSLTCDLSGVSGDQTDGTCTEDDDPCQDFGNLPEDCGCTIDADCQSGKCHNYICCQSNPTVKSKEGCQCQDNTDCIESLTCNLSGVSGGQTDGTCTEDDDPCQDFGNFLEDCGCTIDADCQSGKCHNYICCQSNPTVKSKEGCQCQDNTDCIGSLTCDLSGVSGGQTDGTCTEDDDPCQDFGNLPEDCGCTIDADCQSGKCHNYICCQSNPTVKSKEGCQCQDNTDCIGSLTCDLSGVSGGQTDGTCTEDDDPCQDFGNLPEDCGCTIDADCQSGKCHNYICCQSNPTVKNKEGCQCQDNTDCIGSLTCDLSGVSGGQTDGTCTEEQEDPCQDFGNLPEDCGCTIDSDCKSNKCHNYVCCKNLPSSKSKEGCQCQDNSDCIGRLTCDMSGLSRNQTAGTCTEEQEDTCQDFGNLPEDCGCTIDSDCKSNKCHNYVCCKNLPSSKSKEGCQCQDNSDCIGRLTCDMSGLSRNQTEGTCTEEQEDPCQDFGNLPEDCGCTIDSDCKSNKCHSYVCCKNLPSSKSKEGCQCQDNSDCIGRLTCDMSGLSRNQTEGTCTEEQEGPCQDFGNLPEDCGCTIDSDCKSNKCHNYVCCKNLPSSKSKEGCQCQNNSDCIGRLTCDMSGLSRSQTEGTCTDDTR
ncbi:neurogenic locus notch homolog protein 1-like isoform X1 [Amphibalanus amphitrite]|uniref:neurogenic locus notch homolog protein 1-like isoform X1 n=1 Tax=Amphibalanus amphitrite TaxID=1232801 RepID=UPI001C9222D5|nr:neurogenic locus notch homolog protein 1-like isoform X1 [Amphibalanus amphitrite]